MALYELGLLVSQVRGIPDLFNSPTAVREDVATLYCKLVSLVGKVATHYHRQMTGLRSNLTTVIKFDLEFGEEFDDVWKHKTDLCDRMWKLKIGNKGYTLPLSSLRRKLKSDESSFRSELYSELTEDLERCEDSCEWIKHDLAEFLRGQEKVLTLTGAKGCGKSVLADWVEERLQRRLDHTTYTVLSHFFGMSFVIPAFEDDN